jgi:hypothetical protein
MGVARYGQSAVEAAVDDVGRVQERTFVTAKYQAGIAVRPAQRIYGQINQPNGPAEFPGFQSF